MQSILWAWNICFADVTLKNYCLLQGIKIEFPLIIQAHINQQLKNLVFFFVSIFDVQDQLVNKQGYAIVGNWKYLIICSKNRCLFMVSLVQGQQSWIASKD